MAGCWEVRSEVHFKISLRLEGGETVQKALATDGQDWCPKGHLKTESQGPRGRTALEWDTRAFQLPDASLVLVIEQPGIPPGIYLLTSRDLQ